MTLETILASLSPILVVISIILMVIRWKEKNRIKAKEEVWNENTKSIVNIATEMKNRIDSNQIQDIKELRNVFSSIGHYANSIHTSIEKELSKKN